MRAIRLKTPFETHLQRIGAAREEGEWVLEGLIVVDFFSFGRSRVSAAFSRDEARALELVGEGERN
jgi:hypothetical protein